MKCPHCQIEVHAGFHEEWINNGHPIGEIGAGSTKAPCSMQHQFMVCPACRKPIVKLNILTIKGKSWEVTESLLVYPRRSARPLAPPEVPADLAEDFNEACMVLSDSPKASAALARRCLQAILRQQGYKDKDLAPAIDAAVNSNTLPAVLSDLLHVVRNVGNFAAHPMKDTNTGAILPVEGHEAEWNIDVLEGLFDFYYVQPTKNLQRKAALNAKLQAAGKKTI